MKKISLLIVSLSLVMMPILTLMSAPVFADANSDVQLGISGASSGGPTVNSLITNGIKLFGFVIGVVAVIMVMIGGFKFITAQGDANQVASARNTILYAIVGLAVAALAETIVKFALVKIA